MLENISLCFDIREEERERENVVFTEISGQFSLPIYATTRKSPGKKRKRERERGDREQMLASEREREREREQSDLWAAICDGIKVQQPTMEKRKKDTYCLRYRGSKYSHCVAS